LQAAVTHLEERGPALGRPLSDHIASSRHSNMKEPIPPGTNIRVLYAFDPERRASLLIGGDKTNNWTRWYRVNVPIADDLFDRHLERMRASAPSRATIAPQAPDRRATGRKK
jgi:hypothetical protein